MITNRWQLPEYMTVHVTYLWWLILDRRLTYYRYPFVNYWIHRNMDKIPAAEFAGDIFKQIRGISMLNVKFWVKLWFKFGHWSLLPGVKLTTRHDMAPCTRQAKTWVIDDRILRRRHSVSLGHNETMNRSNIGRIIHFDIIRNTGRWYDQLRVV